MYKFIKRKEKGAIEVEATIIMPITILCILFMLYLSLIMFQRATLQATLETAVMYYKTAVTDTFVSIGEEVTFSVQDGEDETSKMGKGNFYSASTPLNPYIGKFASSSKMNSKELFEKYFYSISGNMLFNENIELNINYKDYLVTKQFQVTATQTIKLPIDFSIIGIGDKYTITASARAAAVDNDAIIRNTDYVLSIIDKTGVGDFLSNISSKVVEAYNSLKESLGVKN